MGDDNNDERVVVVVERARGVALCTALVLVWWVVGWQGWRNLPHRAHMHTHTHPRFEPYTHSSSTSILIQE